MLAGMDLQSLRELVWSETNDWQMSFHTYRRHNNIARGGWQKDPEVPGASIRELKFNLGANSNFLHLEVHRELVYEEGKRAEYQHTSETFAPLCSR